jgi:hypothetical protein
MQTFYIAGSSKNREEIAGLGDELVGYGLRWFSGWDWPKYNAKVMTDALMWAGVVCGDLSATVGCDVFVLYTKPDDPRSMAWAEFGARISHNKEAHVIHHGYNDVFWGHPCVIKHETWDAFVKWLAHDQA